MTIETAKIILLSNLILRVCSKHHSIYTHLYNGVICP